MKKHFARYTPEMVERICGTPKDQFVKRRELVAAQQRARQDDDLLLRHGLDAAHRRACRTSALRRSLQLLLGNIGRPGGGILALRGHATIQGSTDIPRSTTCCPATSSRRRSQRGEDSFENWKKNWANPTGWWSNWPKYVVWLLKAWYGDAARADNDWAFDYLPKITGDHSHMPLFFAMKDGEIEGLLLWGQNPAVGGPERGPAARRRWASSSGWSSQTSSRPRRRRSGSAPGRRTRRRSAPRSSSCPPRAWPRRPARSPTRSAWCSSTRRPSTRRGDCRERSAFAWQLGRKLKELYARLAARDRPARCST